MYDWVNVLLKDENIRFGDVEIFTKEIIITDNDVYEYPALRFTGHLLLLTDESINLDDRLVGFIRPTKTKFLINAETKSIFVYYYRKKDYSSTMFINGCIYTNIKNFKYFLLLYEI